MRVCVLTLAVLFGGAFLAAADTLDGTFDSLKEAAAKKDVAQVKTLAASLFALVQAQISAPAPASAEDKEMWTYNVSHAKDVQLNAEYELSALAYQGPPATTVELLAMIEKENPKSKYLDAAYGRYLVALTQSGAEAQVVPAAEKGLASFPDNEDLLLAMVNSSLAHNQNANALTYARRLVTALNKKAKPEEMAEADWQKKKDADLGRGYWVIGVMAADRNLYAEADKNLRAALPLIRGNDAMMAPALYYLGVANYQLGKQTLSKARVLEGAKFSEEAAALPGNLQQQAWHNANVMKDEANKMR